MGFLTGKTAIITGGGRAVLSDGSCGSIGYGIATAYAKEGANLVITGRNVKKLEDAKEELERLYGIKVLPVQADVSAGADNEATVQNVVKQAIDTFGRIDVLINNAQASASGVTIADHTTDQFNLAMYSGVYAVFYYMQACYPYLKETKGICYQFCFRLPDFSEITGSAHMQRQKKGFVDFPESLQQSGDQTESMSISYARSHGQHSLRIFRKLIRKHLRQM